MTTCRMPTEMRKEQRRQQEILQKSKASQTRPVTLLSLSTNVFVPVQPGQCEQHHRVQMTR
jgi:hypothetical protein